MGRHSGRPKRADLTERFHVVLSPQELGLVSNYRFAGRFEADYEAVRYLMKVALSEDIPEGHQKILEIMREFGDVPAATAPTERIHLFFTPQDLETLDDYRFAARVPSRSEAIRNLIRIALMENAVDPTEFQRVKMIMRSFRKQRGAPDLSA